MRMKNAQWIWLPKKAYPDLQNTEFSTWGASSTYGVAEFQKPFVFARVPEKLRLRVSGDTLFSLYVNGEFTGIGPAHAGGDFLTEKPLPWQFANTYEISVNTNTVEVVARVQLGRLALTEFTSTEGGFYLEGTAVYADGTEEAFGTDETWLCRRNKNFSAASTFDNTAEEDPWLPAEKRPDRELWDAPIPMLSFEPIAFEEVLYPDTEKRFELDKIYAVTPEVEADGPCRFEIEFFELPEQPVTGTETVTFGEPGAYRSFRLYSAGGFRLRVREAGKGTRIRLTLWNTHYPVTEQGWFSCSDEELNRVWEVGKHTLMICRQTMHLDSPKHQELLACTGDYYIEMLMEAMAFGDLRLAALDLVRTARWLEVNDGRMFHTNYSLIWVGMLYKYYMLTADLATVEACHAGLVKLLNRFAGYMGENGVLEHAPDYMFVDWVVTEGYSMHHPPKCLGQTVLNAFYYKALTDAAALAEVADFPEGKTWRAAKEAFPAAFVRAFWDADARMFADGLTTPGVPGQWQPENPDLRHYSRYTAALAVLYGLAPEGEEERLLALAAEDGSGLAPVQPYFMQFVLEAVQKRGARENYMLPLLSKWKPMTASCGKGLAEGWIAPEPTYSFDHSHAWGGAPVCFLPQALLGLEVLEPGMSKLRLSPNLLGLEKANIGIPTPFGMLTCRMEKGKAPVISVPEGITAE